MKKGSQTRRKSLCEFALSNRNAEREISPSAGQRTCKPVHEHFVLGEEAYAASTAPPFEERHTRKRGENFSSKDSANTFVSKLREALVASLFFCVNTTTKKLANCEATEE